MYAALVLALILQATILGRINIFGTTPDLVILLVIFFASFFGAAIGLEAGFFAGIFKDILSSGIFGVNAVILAVTGLVVGILSPKFFRESRITQSLIVFMFVIFSMLLYYVACFFASRTGYAKLSEYLFCLIIPTAIYTSFTSVIIFPFLIHQYRLSKSEEYL